MPSASGRSKLLVEMERFCAYQERSPFEIRKKLQGKANEEEILYCIKMLSERNFINEKRFVQAYIEGKSNIKKWGINKIKAGLKAHRIAENVIEEHLRDLDKEASREQMIHWFKKKESNLSGENDPVKKKQKLVRFLLMKGYTLEEILSLF